MVFHAIDLPLETTGAAEIVAEICEHVSDGSTAHQHHAGTSVKMLPYFGARDMREKTAGNTIARQWLVTEIADAHGMRQPPSRWDTSMTMA